MIICQFCGRIMAPDNVNRPCFPNSYFKKDPALLELEQAKAYQKKRHFFEKTD